MNKVKFTEMKHGTKEDYLLLDKHEKDFERENHIKSLRYLDLESMRKVIGEGLNIENDNFCDVKILFIFEIKFEPIKIEYFFVLVLILKLYAFIYIFYFFYNFKFI